MDPAEGGAAGAGWIPQTPRGESSSAPITHPRQPIPRAPTPPLPAAQPSYDDFDDDYGGSARSARSRGRGGGGGGGGGSNQATPLHSARGHASATAETVAHRQDDEHGGGGGGGGGGAGRGGRPRGGGGGSANGAGSPFPSARGGSSSNLDALQGGYNNGSNSTLDTSPAGGLGRVGSGTTPRTSLPKAATAALLAAVASAAASAAPLGPLDPVQGLRHSGSVTALNPPAGGDGSGVAAGGVGGGGAMRQSVSSGAIMAPLHAPEAWRVGGSKDGKDGGGLLAGAPAVASPAGGVSSPAVAGPSTTATRTTPRGGGGGAAANGGGGGAGGGSEASAGRSTPRPGGSSRDGRTHRASGGGGGSHPYDNLGFTPPLVPQPPLTRCDSTHSWALHLEQGAQNLEGVLSPLMQATLNEAHAGLAAAVGLPPPPWNAQEVFKLLASEQLQHKLPASLADPLSKAQVGLLSLSQRPDHVTADEAAEVQAAFLTLLKEVHQAVEASPPSLFRSGSGGYLHFLDQVILPELGSAVTYAQMLVADITEARAALMPRTHGATTIAAGLAAAQLAA